MFATPASGHVQWSSEFSFADEPLSAGRVLTSGLFWGLTLLSLVTIAALVLLDRRLEGTRSYQTIDGWFERRSRFAPAILRAATAGAVLLPSFQSDTLLVPDWPAEPWLAAEKLVYPQWGLYVLEQNPHLTLGLIVFGYAATPNPAVID